MQLVYTDDTNRTIRAELDEGEVLGHHHGPLVCFVPTDPANREYADILANNHEVLAYQPPEQQTS